MISGVPKLSSFLGGLKRDYQPSPPPDSGTKKPKISARSLVLTPNLPIFKKDSYTGNPFTSEGDMVMDCGVTLPNGKTCGWHAWGSRADTKKAWNEHYKQFHASDQVTGVVYLNDPTR